MALITYLTKTQFDFGALALLPEELAGLGLPAGLAEMGLPERLIPELAEAATKDHCAETNPCQASASDYEALFREAMA